MALVRDFVQVVVVVLGDHDQEDLAKADEEVDWVDPAIGKTSPPSLAVDFAPMAIKLDCCLQRREGMVCYWWQGNLGDVQDCRKVTLDEIGQGSVVELLEPSEENREWGVV